MIIKDDDGKEVITGVPSNRLSEIRDHLIHGDKTLKEKKKKHREDRAKRLDE